MRGTEGARSPWRVLTQHFFKRFYDNDAVTLGGEVLTNVIQTVSVLAVPGMFVSFYLIPVYGHRPAWSMIADHYFFVTYSMVVMGIVAVFEWDMLFPDRRDYMVLTTRPLSTWDMLRSKVAALLLFLAIFLAGSNVLGAVLLPLLSSSSGNAFSPTVARAFGAHAAAVLLAGLFTSLFFVTLQGLLIHLLSSRMFRRLSPLIQMVSVSALLIVLFLFPFLSANLRVLVEHGSPAVYWFPPFWFLGLYETLLRGPEAGAVFLRLSHLAWEAGIATALLCVIAYLTGWRKHSRRILEGYDMTGRSPSRLANVSQRFLHASILRTPVRRAVFHFISQSVTRSPKHRLFLAMYGGLGVALALFTLVHVGLRNSAPRLTLSQEGLLASPLILSFWLISGLRAGFNYPVSLAANWVFQTTEDEGRLEHLQGTRLWVAVYGIGLLFVLLAPLELACFPWPIACFHLAFGVVLSLLLVQVLFRNFRKVPFTCPYAPGKTNLGLLTGIYLGLFPAYVLTAMDLERWLSASPKRMSVFLLASAGAFLLLSRSFYRRMKEKGHLDFQEDSGVGLQTLGLE